jgi:hypothetical protein
VFSADWREIIEVNGTLSNGRKIKHMAAVWIPMKGSSVLMYDAQYGTFILQTHDNSKDAILGALRKLFPSIVFTSIHFLDEK